MVCVARFGLEAFKQLRRRVAKGRYLTSSVAHVTQVSMAIQRIFRFMYAHEEASGRYFLGAEPRDSRRPREDTMPDSCVTLR